MIKSIKLIEENESKECQFIRLHDHKIEIDHSFLPSASFTIQIQFISKIIGFRQHDYTWKSIEDRLLSNWYSPKIIKLENKQLVQSNQSTGIWEINQSTPDVLLWHFNPKFSKPIVQFDTKNNKHILQSKDQLSVHQPLCLLFPSIHAIEVSRSKIPFSAIACFTDHCDFDTLSNLQQQRAFFRKHGLKITKGFFLNHYSKRDTTACFEFHNEELSKWFEDGHELAYHSLSQSLKSIDDSIDDFKQFEPPFESIRTWIDHGFQPYNVSLYDSHEELRPNYGVLLRDKSIYNFWNYVDSGTSVKGVINQINPKQFTLDSFYHGIKHLGLKSYMPLLIKNIIFHHYNTNDALWLYRDLAKYLKSIKRKKTLKTHLARFGTVFKLSRLIFPIMVRWDTKKRKVYPLAKFSPVIFDHTIDNSLFTVFQTIEMIDFKTGLCKENVDLLMEEKGLFIAHTYFSAPLNYHQGKLFGSQNVIDAQVEANFSYLSEHIESDHIWNPTISELIDYFKNLEAIIFDCDPNGHISIVNEHQLPYRQLS